ncbi:Glycosyltransferase [Quillaja saponaria]|uniref:Glycosyltransferase n=1 Tax=Quillaja saponaria TaxID=32244 RepID=A0AAD7Q8C0_QUISA|nr:Glycosyltransferase [Quillaja saponaria]
MVPPCQNVVDQNHNLNGFHQSQISVVMVPFPAQGHLNQLLHLSRLITAYNIPVHYVSTATHNRQATLRIQGWNPESISDNINFHNITLPNFQSPPPNPNAKNKFPSHLQPLFDACSHLREPMTGLLKSLSLESKRVIVIHDSMMASVVQDVVTIANAESYTFHSVSAFTVFLCVLELIGEKMLPFKPRCDNYIPMHIEIPSGEGCFTNEFFDFISAQYEFQKLSAGNLYNTSRIIESPYMELMEMSEPNKKHWATGPFNPVTTETKSSKKGRHSCLDWLDEQERNSVIYISFGTTSTLEDAQIKEIAIGLEQSNQKFIWVLRDADKCDVFNEDQVRKAELPNGFEQRIKGRGLILRDWAPQLEILSHNSTGGFMSHCGWNSCMESITMGIPIAAWPMHSDQPRNSVLITKLLKVGLVVKDWDHRDELVKASVVENVVKKLMASKEGNEIRKKAEELGSSMRKSMDEGGVSRLELDSFIQYISR